MEILARNRRLLALALKRPLLSAFAQVQRQYFSTATETSTTPSSVSPSKQQQPHNVFRTNLILLRHGESEWNATPTFTGWCDVALTDSGMAQAMAAGKLLEDRGFSSNKFNAVYTSQLQRAVLTCHLALHYIAGTDGFHSSDDHNDDDSDSETSKMLKTMPSITRAWQLNERHYGSLQGWSKDDPALLQEFSQEQILSWRRGFRQAPPPMDIHHPYYLPPPAPLTESLKDCQDRVVGYFEEVILPNLVQEQKQSLEQSRSNADKPISMKKKAREPANVLIVAHSNTIRGLCAHLDHVAEENIPHIHIANSVPCIYQIETTIHDDAMTATHEIVSPVSNSKAGASRGQWLFSKENYRRLQHKLGTSESFARSIFDAWDQNGDGRLSRHEVHSGLEELILMDDACAPVGRHENDHDEQGNETNHHHHNIAIATIAGKVWEEIRMEEEENNLEEQQPGDMEDFLTLDEFQRYIVRGCEKHNLLPFFARQ